MPANRQGFMAGQMESSPKTMLALEVLERILRDVDWTGVKVCSLVSRTFHALARRVLFQKVSLSLEPDPKVSDARSSETTRTAQFFGFLLKDANVASFIRELSLDEKRSSRADDTTIDWQGNADNLILLLPRLTRLNHLSIQSNFFSDWTMKNDDLRATIVQLCLLPQLQSLQLSFIHLQQRELSLLSSIPKLTLFCIDIAPDPPMASAGIPTLSSFPPIHLQDLTMTARYSDPHPSVIWSLAKTAGSNLTSLRIYSSPYDDCLLSSLDDIDLRRHPALLSLAICIPLTSSGCIAKMASIFSQLSMGYGDSSSKIKCIEICCDVDDYSFPSQEMINTWNWASLDAVLSSEAYENLERLEITVKKVIRSRNAGQRQRKYKDLEGEVVELFRSRLTVVSKTVLVIAGLSVEEG